MEININQYDPLSGSKYLPLPEFINKRKCCINIQNNDVYCFKWAVIAYFMKLENHPERTSTYNIGNIHDKTIMVKNTVLNFEGLEFPMKLQDIKFFVFFFTYFYIFSYLMHQYIWCIRKNYSWAIL